MFLRLHIHSNISFCIFIAFDPFRVLLLFVIFVCLEEVKCRPCSIYFPSLFTPKAFRMWLSSAMCLLFFFAF